MTDSSGDDESLNCSGELSEIVVKGKKLGKLRIRFPPCPPTRDQSSTSHCLRNSSSSRPTSGESAADSGIFDNYSTSIHSASESDGELENLIKHFKRKCKSKRKEIKLLKTQNEHLRQNAKEQWKARVKSEELMYEMRSHLNDVIGSTGSRSAADSSRNNSKGTNTVDDALESESSHVYMLQQINLLEADIGSLLASKRQDDRCVRSLRADNYRLKAQNASLIRLVRGARSSPADTWPPRTRKDTPSSPTPPPLVTSSAGTVVVVKETQQRLPPVVLNV